MPPEVKRGTMRRIAKWTTVLLLAGVVTAGFGEDALAKKKKKKQAEAEDPYAEYVWPPPPDEPRIKLERILAGRADVEAGSKWKKKLLGASPQSPYDRLRKPFAVAYDPQGRILVTDSGNAALVRFDIAGERMDVLGTQGSVRLGLPMGIDVASDGTIFVADANLKSVVGYAPDGSLAGVFGRAGQLTNPTDVALSPDESLLYVADSKAHRIQVFDRETGEIRKTVGKHGAGEGEFAYPTSLAFDPEGNLLVVDQVNARIQVLDADLEYLDEFGALGVGFGDLVRPKDIAVDEVGFIYVTDNAFNNLQLFDADFTLLTFVGSGGDGPGRFFGASGVAVRGDEFAVVDQLGRRVQVFRFIVPKDE